MSPITITLTENTRARLRHAALMRLYHEGEALTIAADDTATPGNDKPDAHADLLERLASIQATALMLDQLGATPGEQTGATLTAPADVLQRLAKYAIEHVDSEVAEPSYGAERTADWLRAQADAWAALEAIVDQARGAEAVTA